MAVRLVCRACGKRLKLPDRPTHKRAGKCPKCLAPVDLTPALEASAYSSTVIVPIEPVVSQELAPQQQTEREDDPLPYAPPKREDPGGVGTTLARSDDDDPLPYLPAKPALPPALAREAPSREAFEQNRAAEASGGLRPLLAKDDAQPEVLPLDDDPAVENEPDTPPAPVPFRVRIHVLADSARQALGPCDAVLLPHGLFLENEPLKPFLYVPPGSAAESAAPGELTITLPDGRVVAIQFRGHSARALAADTRAFLAGEREVPAPADYRRKLWMLAPAVIFALGLAAGPLVLSQTASLGIAFGLKVGAGFALAGLLANAGVVLLSRRSVPVQLVVMAGVCVLVTGVFLFGATAYLAGRQESAERNKPEPPPPAEPPPPPPPPAPVPALPPPPSHIDRAYEKGATTLAEGDSDVTALVVSHDGTALAVGYADGTARAWPLDSIFGGKLAEVKCDGPVLRVQFDATGAYLFATTATGVYATPRGGALPAPAKIPGYPVAIFPVLAEDRLQFVAVRGATTHHRYLPVGFIQKPPPPPPPPKGTKPKEKEKFTLPGKGDEVIPMGSPADAGRLNATFLAWTPSGKLLAGLPDGTVQVRSPQMRIESSSRDHKAAVKAWAECPITGDFATGDDQGAVGLWPYQAARPTVTSVLATPITGLSFSPSGAWLAVADTAGWLVIWDVAEAKAVHRVKRPTAVKAMVFGPNDDVLILGLGKTVEVWWLPELVK